MKKNPYVMSSVRNLSGRMGYLSSPEFQKNNITGVNNLARHLYQMGGRTQQERMIRDKRRSLDKAVLYSYQGAFVKKVSQTEQPPVRALINPDKVKQDYDDKIISIGFEHEFAAGDVFEWVNTGSYWLVYLQDLTELAYFRSEIRRCRYIIEWLDEDGNKYSAYAAVRGPVETKIDYIQKHGISVDNPNLSLNILLPLNEDTKKQFQRYSKFYLQGDSVCWRVEASDWISTPGILEINAVEYYANEIEDDIEAGLAGAFVLKDAEINTERVERLISGDTFIKPKRKYTYVYTGLNKEGTWQFDTKLPIDYTINDNEITITWTAFYSGQFDLSFQDLTKTIVVESLF